MITKVKSLQKYEEIFLKDGVQIDLLGKSAYDLERLEKVFSTIESMYLFSTENKVALKNYLEKLINNGYNFVLSDGVHDVGLLSMYANDQVKKIAFTSTIGITPSHRKGSFGRNLAKFGLEFLKEMGMVKVKAEVHKSNIIWLRYLQRLKFQIDSETKNDTYIIVRDL